MDVFNTAALACEIIYKSLEAATAFPSESQSLAARFKYDARILRHFCDYFDKNLSKGDELSAEDKALLEESTSYLAVLLQRVEVCKTKLTTQGRWAREMSRLTWALQRKEMKELEAELYEWTKRLDLRLVALPEQARAVMSIGGEQDVNKMSPRLAAKMRLEKFTAITPAEKRIVWERLSVGTQRLDKVQELDPMNRFSLGVFEDCNCLFEYRSVPLQVQHDSVAMEAARSAVGEFAASLNYLDSTVSGLLKCSGFFYLPTPAPAFGLIYRLPQERNGNGAMVSFKDLLRYRDANGRRQRLRYSLNQRLEFARKLATSVFFVHAIGWVHKSIMSQNVLILGRESRRMDDGESRPPTWSISSPYLVGFEVARNDEAETIPGMRSHMPLGVSLYLHPSLQDVNHVRSTMAHDVYSLGVVLLELGVWSLLEERPELQGNKTTEDVAEALFKLANETEILMGRRYREVVQRCLSVSIEGVGSVKLISEVLEKLEDLAQSV